MIELRINSVLLFSFPSMDAELGRHVEDYIARTLPVILAEDRAAVLKQRADLERADREKALQLTGEDIARAIRIKAQRGFTTGHEGHLAVVFRRTLRIPDDGRDYPLPPGLGHFSLKHVDDFADRVPASWVERGGLMMPLYQSEALWLDLLSTYPFALKVAAGKINAITGEPWRGGLNRHPQDYLVLPEQRWLDGFAVGKGIIRQFVAMPLGTGYSVEEQLSGNAEFGGMQLQAYPLKAKVYFEKQVLPGLPKTFLDVLQWCFPRNPFGGERVGFNHCAQAVAAGMGLGAGGRMKQEIYEDPHRPEEWDLETTSRCFVHLCDAVLWREITGARPRHPPVTAKQYARAKLPWFDFYRDDVAVLEGSKRLAGVKSVATLSNEKGDKALTGNDSVETGKVVHCGPKPRPELVREWEEG